MMMMMMIKKLVLINWHLEGKNQENCLYRHHPKAHVDYLYVSRKELSHTKGRTYIEGV